MQISDWITLGLGLIWGIITYALLKQKKPPVWPLILAVGTGIYVFVISMMTSALLTPRPEFISYLKESVIWSLTIGMFAYYTGHVLAGRFPKGL